jgi:hypothetical protein
MESYKLVFRHNSGMTAYAPVIGLVICLQGCLTRLPGQGCRARLPGKAAGQGCQARLPGKAAGQGCWARLPGKAFHQLSAITAELALLRLRH